MAGLLLAIIYLCFISLGLPDSLLGSAWPTMYIELNVPVSYAGLVAMTISFGTIVSALMSDRLTKKFGAKYVILISIFISALSMYLFSKANKFYLLLLISIPYGLSAGGIDAAINNYVALHYESRHMSWLHAMWGVGAATSPYIMGYALLKNSSWNKGYLYVAIIQIVITLIVLISLPLWNKNKDNITTTKEIKNKEEAVKIKDVLKIKGTIALIIMFFSYCAVEQTSMLWGCSYLVLHHGMDEAIASNFQSFFFIGITLGRFLNGFLSMKLNNRTLIRVGEGVILLGIILIFTDISNITTIIGLLIIGLGCAPIYPCIINSTPKLFGEKNSQVLIGLEMASAYVGSLAMPSLFGLIANHITIDVFPIYLIILLTLIALLQTILKITVKEDIKE